MDDSDFQTALRTLRWVQLLAPWGVAVVAAVAFRARLAHPVAFALLAGLVICGLFWFAGQFGLEWRISSIAAAEPGQMVARVLGFGLGQLAVALLLAIPALYFLYRTSRKTGSRDT